MTIARQDTFVVGTGARTPIGLNAPTTAASVRGGVAMMAEHPFMIDKKGAPMVVCADAELPAELGGVERLLALAQDPALEALKPVFDTHGALPSISVLIALPEKRPGRPENLENIFNQRFSTYLAQRINLNNVSCFSLGHAGGLVCMEYALSLIDNGKSPLCLVGGVESYLDPVTLEWLDSIDQLHSESIIWGICPGDAAGFCLLASREISERLNLSTSVKLLSAASAEETNRIRTDTICIGEGLSKVFRKTLEGLPTEDSQVNHTICDMTGEPYRANEYGFAMLRLAGRFAEEADFEAPADCWGDVGSASGPLFLILAAFAALKGYAPGPFTVLWASSEGGLRAAALLEDAAIVG